MEAKIPIGVTCHNERDEGGQWWIVWGADFIGDEPGRKPHPESVFLEEARKEGIRKIVEWTAREYGIEWEEEQLKEWNIKEDKQRKIKYGKEWRNRAVESGLCMRCGVKLIEGEGKCCVNCSSKTIRNLIAIARWTKDEEHS